MHHTGSFSIGSFIISVIRGSPGWSCSQWGTHEKYVAHRSVSKIRLFLFTIFRPKEIQKYILLYFLDKKSHRMVIILYCWKQLPVLESLCLFQAFGIQLSVLGTRHAYPLVFGHQFSSGN